MAKKRVYELARELGFSTSKELIERAKALGFSEITSHANSLDDQQVLEFKSKLLGAVDQSKPKTSTVLRRRAVRAESSENIQKCGGGYEIILTRISEKGARVIDRKQIDVATPSRREPEWNETPKQKTRPAFARLRDTKALEMEPPSLVPVIDEPVSNDTFVVSSDLQSGQALEADIAIGQRRAGQAGSDRLEVRQKQDLDDSTAIEESVDKRGSESQIEHDVIEHQIKVDSTQNIDRNKISLTAPEDLKEFVTPMSEITANEPSSTSDLSDSSDVAVGATGMEQTELIPTIERSFAAELAHKSANDTLSASAGDKVKFDDDLKAEIGLKQLSTPEKSVIQPTTRIEEPPIQPIGSEYKEKKRKVEQPPQSSSVSKQSPPAGQKQKSNIPSKSARIAESSSGKKAIAPSVDKHEEERAIINLPVLGPNWNEMSTRRRPPAVHGPEDLSTGIQRDRKGEKAKDSKQRVPRPDKRDKIIESGFELPSANKRQQKKSRVSHPVQEFDETGGRTGRKQRKPERSKLAEKDKHTTPQPADMPEKKRVIKVDGAISIGELAHRMGVKASELIRTLLAQGVMATINQVLTLEQATMLASKFNYDIQNIAFIEEEVLKRDLSEEDPSFLVARPPVVTVMGHVDHGKTSLLDAIRETHVADQEAGGITQHIGASRVELPDKGTIVFLDTPGHEAFTAMRLRGAQSTDIVILVVAADDGVMPQTIEAINHAKAAEVPIIVAINKVDKAGADPMRVRYSLMQYNLLSEEFGGDVMMVEVSAHTKQGLNDLLESVLLQAEIMELKANPNKRARGVVVESRLEMGRGPVAILLIQEGTLRVGESIIAGVHHGKIRAMFDADNQVIQEAGPSMPVKILGLSGTPAPGEVFDCLEEEKMARQIASHRFEEQRRKEFAGPQQRARLDDLWGEQKKELNVILKTDVEGTLEALKQSLLKLENREIQLNISHAAVGGITENDINLASATNSIVFGFYVRADAKAQSMAESQGIEIRTYRVIYELLDDIRAVMERQLAPTLQEKPVGQAEIRKIFTIPKVGHVAGCYVTDGKITRGSLIRLYRSNIQIYEGKVATLRRFKNDVKEVSSGYECGIQIDGYQDIRENDMIEAYEIEEIASKLNLGT